MTLHHDEDVEVYLNGKLVLQKAGHVSKYQTHDITRESADVLQTGKNVIAVNCRQTVGGQYIDLGLECFEEAVDLAGLIRKYANRSWEKDLTKITRTECVISKGILIRNQNLTIIKFWR